MHLATRLGPSHSPKHSHLSVADTEKAAFTCPGGTSAISWRPRIPAFTGAYCFLRWCSHFLSLPREQPAGRSLYKLWLKTLAYTCVFISAWHAKNGIQRCVLLNHLTLKLTPKSAFKEVLNLTIKSRNGAKLHIWVPCTRGTRPPFTAVNINGD